MWSSYRRAAIVASLLVLAVVLGGCWFIPPSVPQGKATQTTLGSIGPYRFASDRELKEFTSAARAWFAERGFAPDADTTFSQIADAASPTIPNAGEEWEGHGVLLSRRYGTVGRAYVFIPDYYPPQSRIQRVGYYISLSGNSDEVQERRHDFDATKAEFVVRFPEDKV
jgi:hypothetical protein